MSKRLKGFALVEVSIALLILGMITSITMKQMAMFNKLRKEQITKDNMEFIVKALGAYYLNKNGKLPKPSTNILVTDGFGTVPWVAIGIMEQYSKDGYGRPLLYKCNASVCGDNTNNQVTFKDNNYAPGFGVNGFDLKNDRLLFIIKTVDEKQKIWYNEKVFTQIYCQGKTFRILAPTTSIGSKF